MKNENNTVSLKNEFQVNFGGITLFSDPGRQAFVSDTDEVLVLSSWEKNDDNAFTLSFTNDVKIQFSSINYDSPIPVHIKVSFPEEVTSIAIPYRVNGSYTLAEATEKSIKLSSKSGKYLLSSYGITDGEILFSADDAMAYYSEFVERTEFKFEDILDFALAQKEKYTESVNAVNTKISTVMADNQEENISEKVLTAYVAEMAKAGKFTQTVKSIPSSLTAASKRSYLSAPYFNNLVKMNNTLVMQLDNIEYRMNYSIEQNNPSVFEFDNFSMYLLSRPIAEANRKLAALVGENVAEPSVLQSVGIIKTYCDLYDVSPDRAAVLKNAADLAVARIEKACSIENDESLLFAPDGVVANIIDEAKTGVTLYRYGIITNHEDWCRAGYLLFNQAVASADLNNPDMAVALYELNSRDNPYYPHMAVIGESKGNPIWAWTCAPEVSYTVDENGTRIITTEFPQGDTHYMIINGIEDFDLIKIYNMAFRTDSRFETYNSSGYVHDSETNTLFLKYRHKSGTELVELYNHIPEKKAPIKEPAETAEEQKENSSPVEGNSSEKASAGTGGVEEGVGIKKASENSEASGE